MYVYVYVCMYVCECGGGVVAGLQTCRVVCQGPIPLPPSAATLQKAATNTQREREREKKEKDREKKRKCMNISDACISNVCVCVCEGERERGRKLVCVRRIQKNRSKFENVTSVLFSFFGSPQK